MGQQMRFKRKAFIIVFLILSGFVSAYVFGAEADLRDLYAKGKIRFIKEYEISDKSLPQGQFLQNPRSVALDGDGNIYVCDAGASHIKKFNSKGELAGTIGREGSGPGELSLAEFIEVVQDRLVIWEWGNRRLSVFNLKGEFLKATRLSDEDVLPWKIRGLPNGQIVIEKEKTDFNNLEFPQECRIDLYSSDLQFIKTIYSRKLYVAKPIFKPRVNVSQPFNPRVHWDVSPEGRIIIGFSENYEIEVFDPADGKMFSFSHQYAPVKVNEEDKNRHFSIYMVKEFNPDATTKIRKGAPDYIKDNTGFPKLKPAFKNICVDGEGNIWVQPYNENRDEEDRYFDAFDREGKFLNHVEIVGQPVFSYWNSRFYHDYFWQIETDEDGYYHVVRYRISN